MTFCSLIGQFNELEKELHVCTEAGVEAEAAN